MCYSIQKLSPSKLKRQLKKLKVFSSLAFYFELGNNSFFILKDLSHGLTHQKSSKRVEIPITEHPGSEVDYPFSCPFGNSVDWVELDGQRVAQNTPGNLVTIPPMTDQIVTHYSTS